MRMNIGWNSVCQTNNNTHKLNNSSEGDDEEDNKSDKCKSNSSR